MTRAACLALLLASACIPEYGPLMDPGEDCLECHGGDGEGGGDDEPAALFGFGGDDGPPWTVAGTVYGSETAAAGDGVRGARIHLTDAAGRTVTLHSNQAGNFYLADSLAFPLARVTVERDGLSRTMPSEPGDPERFAYGGCNRCHRPGDEGRVSYR